MRIRIFSKFIPYQDNQKECVEFAESLYKEAQAICIAEQLCPPANPPLYPFDFLNIQWLQSSTLAGINLTAIIS